LGRFVKLLINDNCFYRNPIVSVVQKYVLVYFLVSVQGGWGSSSECLSLYAVVLSSLLQASVTVAFRSAGEQEREGEHMNDNSEHFRRQACK
jgi:hypothetical protein